MFSSSALSFLVSILGSGVTTDVGVAADVGVVAGRMAIEFDEPARPALALNYGIQSGLRLRSRRGNFIVALGPAWTLQIPNVAEVDRPLLQHLLQTSYEYRITRRLSYEASAGGSYGEVSYNSYSEYLDPGTGTLRGAFQKQLNVFGTTGLGYQATKNHRLATSISGGYRETLDDGLPEGASGAAIPSSYNASLTLSDAYIATAADQFTLTLRGTYIGLVETADPIPTPSDVANTGATLTYQRRLSRRSSARASGGGTFSYGISTRELDFVPEANAAHTITFRVGEWNCSGDTAGGVRGFFDQATATYRTQGFASWDLGGEKNRTYSLGLNVFGSTTLSRAPVEPPAYETLANVTARFGYRLSRSLRLRLGSRYGVRAPHLRVPNELQTQREIVGFIGLRGNLGTDRSAGAWVP